ncbi:MAG: glycosyltransferase family protein [Polyangiaceae bacterium]|nr:glycosyltransferase family protein [Polyangiaceae bacterium]
MKTLVVVQARMGSSRLPGKVALDLAGAPLLVRMVERLRAASTPFEICVATSTLPEDDRVVELARQADVRCHRGHPLDCLNRHVTAARELGCDYVVKIPSDCPLIDPAIVDEVLGVFLAAPGSYDYLSNLHPGTWPDGNDVEIMPFSLLELADREATRDLEREHTTPFFWENPARFRIGNVRWSRGVDLSMSHRFTIDYPEDYRFIAAVFEALYQPAARPFSLDDILDLVEKRPEIFALNEKYAGVNWYRHHLDELKTITPSMTKPL